MTCDPRHRQPPDQYAPLYEPIFVARQPIFDQQEQIWAYELLFRHSAQSASALITDQEVATSRVIVDGFAMASNGIDPGKRMFINFPEGLLLKGAPLALPPDACAIEILESVRPTPQILAVCRKYKEAGYLLALDDFVGQAGFEPLLELADLVKVDVAALAPAALIELTQRLAHHGCRLLAEKVETRQMYDLTRSLGYRYFQGYFFSRPEIVSGRKISMAHTTKIRLLQELTREDYQVRDLIRIISTDVSLSYRLLTYNNSAAYARRQKISSVPHALAIMGRDPLRQWLAAVILSDLDHSPRAEEIVFTSVRRGRFLELQSHRLGCSPYRPDTLFLLGLFSQLDALLGLEMKEILMNTPLDPELSAALSGQRNRPYRWITLARTLDHGDWPRMENLLAEFHLRADEVACRHQEASVWTRNLLDSSKTA